MLHREPVVMDNWVSIADGSVPQQPTFGKMTLEDFLVKAGVVREPDMPHVLPQQQQYGVFQSSNTTAGPSFVPQPIMGPGSIGCGQGGAYSMHQGGGLMKEASCSGYADGKGDGGFRPVPPSVGFAPRVGSGVGSVFEPAHLMGMAGPVSPVLPDGALDRMGHVTGGMRYRRRIMDGAVNKAIERRQRRMIKNRESAARSRARKQAYIVELEVELNQLKDENAHLKQMLVELEKKSKQQCFEEMRLKDQNKAKSPREKSGAMRRNLSCPGQIDISLTSDHSNAST